MPRLLVVAFALLLVGRSAAHAEGVAVGSAAPELVDAHTRDGKPFTLKPLRGGWVVMTFGASWCKPCKAELLAWNRLGRKYAGKVTFVAINLDNERKRGEKFIAKLKLTHMKVAFAPEAKSPSGDTYMGGDDPKIPTTFVIDPKGIVRLIHPEYHDGDEGKLAAALDKLLARP